MSGAENRVMPISQLLVALGAAVGPQNASWMMRGARDLLKRKVRSRSHGLPVAFWSRGHIQHCAVAEQVRIELDAISFSLVGLRVGIVLYCPYRKVQ